MGSAGFFLAINLLVAGLIAVTFMTIAVHDPRRIFGALVALAFHDWNGEPDDRIRHRHLWKFAVACRG